MKPVFKCDYCDTIGTEEEIKKHEVECTENYTRRSCFTCKYGRGLLNFKCAAGTEIPGGKFVEFCKKYERREEEEDQLDGFINMMRGW